MVGVFCALILMVESPLPTVIALIALLISYLFTCIFIFGSFRGFVSEDEGEAASRLQLGLPGRFVVLFCLSSLAALFGTYSALDPIAGLPTGQSAAANQGTVTLRFKQTAGGPQASKARSATAQSSAVKRGASREKVAVTSRSQQPAPDVAITFQEQKPILASLRSDELIGRRTIRSHAWAVREVANLPAMLTLPSVLFSILYGEDEPEARSDMVIAKRETGGSARMMVAFLTSPQNAFKNHPTPRAGGTIVVQKRETVALMRPAPTQAEPITVVQKTPAARTADKPAGAITTAKLDPVAAASTKQDLQQVARTAPAKPTAVRTPDILLPPVLASIFYGRPGALEPAKEPRRSPRLTTLFKTSAPDAVKLVAADPVTVVAKTPPVAETLAAAKAPRHPIALAALADNHRMNRASREALGGPFTKVVSDVQSAGSAGKELQPVVTPSVLTGSISPNQIDSAIRSLRFVPRFKEASETQRQVKREEAGHQRGAKSDLSAASGQVVDKAGDAPQPAAKDAVAPQQPAKKADTVILKQEASTTAVSGTKVALAALPDDGGRLVPAEGRSTDHNTARLVFGRPDAQMPAPQAAARSAAAQSASQEEEPDKLRLNLAPEKPRKAPLSDEAMRKANEEINSALRGAEADLKDTDALLDEINVIWSEQDKSKRRKTKRPDKKAAVELPKAVPAASLAPGAIVIEPAAVAHSQARPTAAGNKGHKRVRLPALAERKPEPATAEASASDTAAKSVPKGQKRQLLGYIGEKGSLGKKDSYVACGVVGPDSKLRRCSGRSIVTKL